MKNSVRTTVRNGTNCAISSDDRRVQKTKTLLHEALGSLIREKPYDDIVVQEILDRANVGRSTFYMHFRDKDELLVSGIHDLLGLAQAAEPPASGTRAERLIAFSLPIFEHIHRHMEVSVPRMGVHGRAIVHERLQQVIAERIAGGAGRARKGIPPDVVTRYVASTFVLVLDWWVESRNPLPPKEVDAVFRGLVLPTLNYLLATAG